MFFLFRAAFWLTVVWLLLPAAAPSSTRTARAEPASVSMQPLVSRAAGYCLDHPALCGEGLSVIATIRDKLGDVAAPAAPAPASAPAVVPLPPERIAAPGRRTATR